MVSLDGREFRSVRNSSIGEVDAETVFHYHEADGVVWADYSGEQIVRGMLIARNTDGSLDARYQHVNAGGELPTGI